MDFMKLIFKIINNPQNCASSDNCKVFNSNTAIIGRSTNVEWTLADPDRFISSKHAEISFRDNNFYIRDISSNGIIDANTEKNIDKNISIPISQGNSYYIGEYLIQAELENTNQLPPSDQAQANNHAEWGNQMDDFWGNSTDPLDLLALNQPESDTAELKSDALPSLANSIERTPAFKQAMSFNPVELHSEKNLIPETDSISSNQQDQNLIDNGIPENWDNTSFSLPNTNQPSPTNSLSSSAVTNNNSLTEKANSDDDFFQGLENEDYLSSEISPITDSLPQKTDDKTDRPSVADVAQALTLPEPILPELAEPTPTKQTLTKQALSRSPLSRPESNRPRKRQVQTESPSSSTSESINNDNLLQAAKQSLKQQGFDDNLLTEETAIQWLELMPTIMQGTLGLLQARASIKNEFRVSKTLLTTSDNNPLKFSVNAEDAILSLFHQKRSGFLTAQPAFEQAFTDINLHQSALLHGVRVAMMRLLKQFDAENLEKEFTPTIQNNKFLDKLSASKNNQSKLWQQYKDLYNSEYKVDSDDNFQRIFGENFAEAYDDFGSNN